MRVSTSGSMMDNLISGHPAARFFMYAILAVSGSVLLTLAAKTNLPVGPVKLSMQTMAVFVIAATFGLRLGLATMLFWLAQGALGLPVFQGTPDRGIGLAYMVGPTGGYLAGFVVATVIVGWAADRGFDRSFVKFAAALLVAEAAIMALGFAWLSTLIGAEAAFAGGVAPFILPDLIKLAILALAVPLAWQGLRAIR